VSIESYRDLDAWKLAMELAEQCYRLSLSLPPEERFALAVQIRKAAASVPANIAEGYGRDSLLDYIRFLRIAQGSLKEVETHLILAVRVGLLKPTPVDEALATADRVGRIIRGLIRSLVASQEPK
jgi:four helix bundle protein